MEGTQLDHYAVERLVATSTTASIYRSADLRTSQSVAIRIPHLAVEADALFYQRFQREQQIGYKLNHPSIVKFVNDDKRSRVYLVMEWAEGRPLRHILGEQGKLPPERALRIAVALCDAVEYLHTQASSTAT